MSKTTDKFIRTFVIVTLVGLGCFTCLLLVAAYSTHEVMLLVMALYFGGIGLTTVGIVGLIASLLWRVIAVPPSKEKNA